MVWDAVTGDGRFPLVFIYQDVNNNQEVYPQMRLSCALMQWAHKQEQDPAPSHKARETQVFLRTRFFRSYSPGSDPMDFSRWATPKRRLPEGQPSAINDRQFLKTSFVPKKKNMCSVNT